MANGVRIEKLTREGIALMQEERALALKGDIAGLEELNKRKVVFLGKMEALAAAKTPPTINRGQREELETLFEIIRRRAEENQSLLRAAAAGVKNAHRRLTMIQSRGQDIGAYNKDGSPIKNNDALIQQSHIA